MWRRNHRNATTKTGGGESHFCVSTQVAQSGTATRRRHTHQAKSAIIVIAPAGRSKDASRVCRRPVIQFGRLSAVERPAA